MKYLIVALFVLFVACNTNPPMKNESGPLEGVWELESAEWTTEDSTMIFPSPGIDLKSRKYYSKEYFFVIGKEYVTSENYALAGKYLVNGQEYTEIIQFNSFDNMEDTVNIKYSVGGDILTLESDLFTENWKRVE